jgi:ABC-type glutathione transport system ATPase component
MPPVTAQFLNDVSFQVYHGEVHGVVGSAGCGKSTLLQVIADRAKGNVTGEVFLNGQKLTGEWVHSNTTFGGCRRSLCSFV